MKCQEPVKIKKKQRAAQLNLSRIKCCVRNGIAAQCCIHKALVNNTVSGIFDTLTGYLQSWPIGLETLH